MKNKKMKMDFCTFNIRENPRLETTNKKVEQAHTVLQIVEEKTRRQPVSA
jgi:hypothetical protein